MKHLLRGVLFIVLPFALAISLPWIVKAIGPLSAVVDSPRLFIPQTFGEYGYYRGANVQEWAERPALYSEGAAQCAVCHQAEAQLRAAGPHVTLSCETCHGPAGPHAQQGSQLPGPRVNDARSLCVLCHDANVVGRPVGFPQVNPALHAGELNCTACHSPHNPKVKG